MRSIPPRTSTGKRMEASRAKRGWTGQERDPAWKVRSIAKPRQWVYATSPIFKKVREPLVDVFREAEKVQILIDLGSFCKEDIHFGRRGDRYVVSAKKGEQEFQQEIALPPDVDVQRMRESLRNGILEISLPKRVEGRAKSDEEGRRSPSSG